MRRVVKNGLAALIAAVVAGSAHAAVVYTFDTDNQGWRVGNVASATPAPDAPANWSNGRLVAGEGYDQVGVFAPTAVLGDQSAAYGSTISFDVSDAVNDNTAYAALILYGANGLAAAVNGGPPSTDNNALSTFSFTLDETTFSAFTGGYFAAGAITQSQFKSILADLSGIGFTTEYVTGNDDSRFDNAVFSGFGVKTSAVPEPASWAMMVAGFGAIGGAMRRRQKTRITFA